MILEILMQGEFRTLESSISYLDYGLSALLLKKVDVAMDALQKSLFLDDLNIEARYTYACMLLLENQWNLFYEWIVETLFVCMDREDFVTGYDWLFIYCLMQEDREGALKCIGLRYSFDQDLKKAKGDTRCVLNQGWDRKEPVEIPVVWNEGFLFQQSVLLEQALSNLKRTGQYEEEVVEMLKQARVYMDGEDVYTSWMDESMKKVNVKDLSGKVHLNTGMFLDCIVDLEKNSVEWV